MNASALIAEDEPLLAQALQAALHQAWPQLQVLATVGDGASAVGQARALQPDLLVLDIRMPGLSGLEASAELADAWPAQRPFPLLVFVTAYDQYAVQAFEAQALDYLLKPLQPARLQRTVARLQHALAQRGAGRDALEGALDQLRGLLTGASATPPSQEPPLTVIQASVGSTIHLVPIASVLYLEAADKYLRVLTAEAEYLIRTPLKELLPRLDPATFWQIHRGTVVRASEVHQVRRDEAGKVSLALRSRPELLAVSRLYAQRFRAM